MARSQEALHLRNLGRYALPVLFQAQQGCFEEPRLDGSWSWHALIRPFGVRAYSQCDIIAPNGAQALRPGGGSPGG